MQNAEAGPSNGSTTQAQPRTTPEPEPAPLRPLPATHFYSVEYPGYVKQASVPLALERLGGLANIEAAFKRGGNKSENVLELNMRPDNPFTHLIPGEVIPANNILLKVVKRRRKKDLSSSGGEVTGEYTIEAVGVIAKSARFRSKFGFDVGVVRVC